MSKLCVCAVWVFGLDGERMGQAWRYERVRCASRLSCLRALTTLALAIVLSACPEEAPPRDVSGVGGVPTEFMGAGGAPPVGGMTGGSAGIGSGGGASGADPGGMSGGAPPAGIGGGVPPGGEGGMGPIMDRVFDAGSDPGRNIVHAGMLCARLAQIQCAGEAFCCEDPGRDVATCQSAMQKACEDEAYLDAISGNSITAFDEGTASTTFEELERLASMCDPNIVSYSISRDGLMSMFRGTAASGASCMPLGTDPKQAAAKLASCADIGTTACLPTSLLSWKCAPRGTAGAQCFTDVNCVDGMYCPNPELKIGQFKCEPRKPLGAGCTWGNECESLFCDAGACVPPSQRVAYCLKLQM